MSHISLHTSPNNPVTSAHLEATLQKFAPEAKLKPADVEDYTKILAGAYGVFDKINNLPDYVPTVDRERFPREDVHKPTAEENASNAWAYKASVKGGEGPLRGVTVCLKDNIALADVPCSVGTSYIEGWVPQVDAAVATRVLEAGAEITGKAVCENLSYFGASISSGTGHMDNVYAKGYSAGGSSSGCGVLVARGDCDMAIGGDQGGSIRLPAAHNGIVGMKPTHGLVPYTGICLLERTIDTTGPMTKDVMSNARLLGVLAGADNIDDRQLAGCPLLGQVPDYCSLAKGGVKGLRIGIVAESLDTDLTDKRYADFVCDAAEKFVELGATVEKVSLPGTVLASDLWMVIARLSAFQNLTGKACGHRALYLNDFTKKFLPLNQDKLDQMWPSAIATLTTGAYAWDNMDPTLMGKTMNLARKVRDDVDRALDKYDVLLTPTMVRLPVRIDNVQKDAPPLEKMAYAAGVGLNTCPYSLETGHPAISIPVGFLSPVDDPKVALPVGMQLIGRFYDEGTVYRAAYAWESSQNWKQRVYQPPAAQF